MSTFTEKYVQPPRPAHIRPVRLAGAHEEDEGAVFLAARIDAAQQILDQLDDGPVGFHQAPLVAELFVNVAELTRHLPRVKGWCVKRQTGSMPSGSMNWGVCETREQAEVLCGLWAAKELRLSQRNGWPPDQWSVAQGAGNIYEVIDPKATNTDLEFYVNDSGAFDGR